MQTTTSTYQNRGNFYLSSTNSVLNACRSYELSNHLGSVISVISDKVIPHSSNGTAVDYYLADILQSSDYSAFGVILSGRNFNKNGNQNLSRFGFDGMEKDNELKGDGNSYTTEFRQYDPRLGRWLSIDPMYGKFPWQSPYVAFDNNPIYFNDPNGASAQGGDKGYTNNKDGSRSRKNSDGSNTYDSPGFTEVTIPARAKILGTLQDFNNDGKIGYKNTTFEASKGDLRQFSVDNVIYTATFNNKGKFLGYFNDKGKKYVYTPTPNTTGSNTNQDGLCDNGTVSKSSWGETQGIYPTKTLTPTEAEKYNPEKWDAQKTDQLLEARAGIDFIANNRNPDVRLDNPDNNAIEKTLSIYHMDCNLPKASAAITSNPNVSAFFLGKTAYDKHTGMNYNTHDVTIVARYGPFFNIGGGDVSKGEIWILFYSVKKK